MTIEQAMDRMRQLRRAMSKAGLSASLLMRESRAMLAAAASGDVEDFEDGGAATLMGDMEWAIADAEDNA